MPEEEDDGLPLFLSFSGLRGFRPGASPGDLAPLGIWCSNPGRSSGSSIGASQNLVPFSLYWRAKSSLPRETRKLIFLPLSNLVLLPILVMALNLLNNSFGMYLTTSGLSSPSTPFLMYCVKLITNCTCASLSKVA